MISIMGWVDRLRSDLRANWADRIIVAAIGGVGGLIVVAIYIVVRASLVGATDGEWLNFAAVILGVLMTAFAGAGIALLPRWLDARAAQQRIVKAMDDAEALLSVIEEDSADLFQDAFSALIEAIAIIRETERTMKDRSFEQLVGFREFRAHIETRLDDLMDAYNTAELHPNEPSAVPRKVWPIRTAIRSARASIGVKG